MHNDMVRSKGKRWNVHKNEKSHQCIIDKIGSNVEEDRLSNLPDDLIHEILSFLSAKQAVETSVLSSRWRFIWTSSPYLNFSTQGSYPNCSSKFVSSVFLHRIDQIQVSSLNLVPRDIVSRRFVKRALNYAFYHNIQQLTVKCALLHKNSTRGFHLTPYSSQSLKHLVLDGKLFIVNPTWDLPALTKLDLCDVTLFDEHAGDKCIGLFSNCIKLKDVYLKKCKMMGTKNLNLYHPRLEDLRLEYLCCKSVVVVNVVAPQLKNLTINDNHGKRYMISAPGLTSLVIEDCCPKQISTQGFCFVEKLDLYIDISQLEYVVPLLHELHNIKFLTLNLEILEELLLSPYQPIPYASLIISKFIPSYPPRVYLEMRANEKSSMSTETKNNSVIFTMVSHEEIGVMRDMVKAKRLMGHTETAYYSVIVDRDNAPMKSMSSKSKVKKRKQWTQSKFKMHWHFEEMMAQISQGKLEDLLTKWHFRKMMEQSNQGKIEGLPTNIPIIETCDMILSLQCIEGRVAELPASKRVVMQAAFVNLCEDAVKLINNMLFDGNYKGKPWCE